MNRPPFCSTRFLFRRRQAPFASLKAALLPLALFALWAAGGDHGAAAADPPAAVVQMTIDYGDGVEKRFTAIPWQADMTILDALQIASRHPRGIRFEHRGSGETGFLTKIDDTKNEGRGRNWVYSVGGKKGEISFMLQKLAAGDVVLWKFAEYR